MILLYMFKVERFNVSGLHKVSVTTVEWSKNGMKLYSGDENGLVVLTEMDFNLVWHYHISMFSKYFINLKPIST